MTIINPVTVPQTQATAFKGKNVNLANMIDKLSKKELTPLLIVEELNSPLKNVMREGRSKEEIKELKERLICEYIHFARMNSLFKQFDEAISKMSAKNGYKPL